MFNPQKLKEARLKAGYTQEQVANILGIHPVSYSRWETGEREPKASYLLKLSSLLNVPIEYFFISEDDARVVGLKIKKKREELNLTQEKLAELLGVSRSAVSKWEIGNRKPSYSYLKKLSKVLDVPVTYFFESSEKKEKDVFNYEILINPQEIKKARTEKGLTQEELAKFVGVDRVTVARWENGTMKPSGESLLKLQKILGLTLQQSFSPKSLDNVVDVFLLYLKNKGIKDVLKYKKFVAKKFKEIEEEVGLLEE